MAGPDLDALPMEIMRGAAIRFTPPVGAVVHPDHVLVHRDFRHCVRFNPSIQGCLRVSVSWLYNPPETDSVVSVSGGVGARRGNYLPGVSAAYHREVMEFDLDNPDLVDQVYHCMRDRYYRRVSYDELQRTLAAEPLIGGPGDATPR